MPVRFTYANFPSLWDDIISFSDHEAQLVIRSIDQGLRSTIDARQVRHLILSPELGNIVNVRGPYHRAAALATYGITMKFLTTKERAVCAKTSVVDIRGFFHPAFDLRPIAPLFPNLKILRLTSDAEQQVTPYVPFPTETLVLFSNPSGLGGVYEHWYFRHPSESPASSEPGSDVENDFQYEVHGRRLAPRGVSRHKLPADCKRIVVNMCGDHSPPSTIWPMVENPPPHVKNVTIVVPRYKTVDGEGGMDPDCVESVLAIGILEMLRAPHPNFTLVGVDEVSDEYEDRLRELLRTDATQVVHSDVNYSIDDPLTSEMPVQMRRFAQEASEQMRLALQENPDAGHGEEEKEAEGTDSPEDGDAVATATEKAAAVSEDAAAAEANATKAAEDCEAFGSNTTVREEATVPEPEQADDTEQPESTQATTTAGEVGTVSAPSTPDGPVIPPSTSAQPLMSLQQKVDNFFARIEFLTKEQYIERVGEEAAALELLEYINPSEYDVQGTSSAPITSR